MTTIIPASTSSEHFILPAENDPFVAVTTEVSSSGEDGIAEMTAVFRVADGMHISAFVLDVCGEPGTPQFTEEVVAQRANLSVFAAAVSNFLNDANEALGELEALIA